TPKEAKDYPLTGFDKIDIERNRNRGMHIVGSAEDVAETLLKEQAIYGFDEAMICSIPHAQAKRLNVYRLLAEKLLYKALYIFHQLLYSISMYLNKLGR